MKFKFILFLINLGVVVVNSEINYVDIRLYENFTVPDLRLVCLNYSSGIVSEICSDQLNIVCNNISILSTMLDASSKFPYTGLGYATKMDYGNFDQCMTIDHRHEGGRILGEHCTMGLVIPDLFGNISDIYSSYILAVCRPKGCTANDFNAIIANLTNLTLPLFQDGLCQNIYSGSEFTAADIVTMLIISVCVLLMIMSTLYHFYLQQKQLGKFTVLSVLNLFSSAAIFPECPNQLYLAFSAIYNGQKLLHVTRHSKEQIQVFQGIRVISMMWVIAGHGLAVWLIIGVVNAPDEAEWQQKMSSVYMNAAPLAVDTFFFISGFLLAYQYLKQKPKPFMDHVKTIPSMYLHRYLRLTPAVAMVLLVSVSLIKHFGSGPLWDAMTDSSICRKNWWSLFLYIQNYYNYSVTDLCLPVTWYLSADMQMFVLSPLVIIPVAVYLQKSKGFELSMVLMSILNVFFIALPMTTKLIYRDYTNNFDTHSRLIDYFIGAQLGIFMRVKQEKPFLFMINSTKKSIINLLIWITILSGMFTTFLCYREVELHHGYVSQSIFFSLMRPAWCVGLSWIVYSCHHGYGGIINCILCRPIFQVWGRLTYCMYILHMEVILPFAGSVRTRSYFTDYNGFYAFCGHFVVTLILSVFWTLAFESPLITIEKVVFGGGKKNKEDKLPNYNYTDGEVKESAEENSKEIVA